MKIILIKFSHSYLFMSKFKTLIQSWKYEKNIQKNKLAMELKLFQKKSTLVSYSHQNSMVYNEYSHLLKMVNLK